MILAFLSYIWISVYSSIIFTSLFSTTLEEITDIIKFLTIIFEDKKEDKEWLFYYYLTRIQKEPVIIIKSPNDKSKWKEFLG